MRNVQRKIGFVLAASGHGTLIVNRFDYHKTEDRLYGVGGEILEGSVFDPQEIELVLSLLRLRREFFGDGAVMIDCGANIGVHTVEAAIEMTGWGTVLAVEAQERLFYALAGNIALNNCFNARALHAAVAAEDGTMRVPVPDYLSAGSFGSLEMKPGSENEFIGQTIDYSDAAMREVRTLKLDSLTANRIDLIKIDVEGMETEVLAGGAQLIVRHQPIMLVEWLKSPKDALRATLEQCGYRVFEASRNFLAIHQSHERCLDRVQPQAG